MELPVISRAKRKRMKVTRVETKNIPIGNETPDTHSEIGVIEVSAAPSSLQNSFDSEMLKSHNNSSSSEDEYDDEDEEEEEDDSTGKKSIELVIPKHRPDSKKPKDQTMRTMAKALMQRIQDVKDQNAQMDELQLQNDKISKSQIKTLQDKYAQIGLAQNQDDHWVEEIKRGKRRRKQAKAVRTYEIFDEHQGDSSNDDVSSDEDKRLAKEEPLFYNPLFRVFLNFKIPRVWIMSYRSKWKKSWDYMIIILATYNSFEIPFSQAYKPYFMDYPFFTFMNNFIDFLFLLDIILMFFTSTLSPRGKQIYDSRFIAAAFTNTARFYIDALSLLGANVVTMVNPYFRLFGLFKMLRVFRISSLIKESTVDEVTKAILNLGKLIFYLLFYLHCLGCYWWLTVMWNAPEQFHWNIVQQRYLRDPLPFEEGFDGLTAYQTLEKLTLRDDQGLPVEKMEGIDIVWGKYENFDTYYWPEDYQGVVDPEERAVWASRPKFWYAPLDFINYVDQETFTSKFNIWKRGTMMLYYAVLILGSNEMGPVNEYEMLFCIFALLISALLNSLLFGDIAVLASTIGKGDAEYQEKLDQGNGVMDNFNLDEETQAEIREFFLKTHTTREGQSLFNGFLDQISPSLRQKVQNALFAKILMENRVISESFGDLVRSQEIMMVKPKQRQSGLISQLFVSRKVELNDQVGRYYGSVNSNRSAGLFRAPTKIQTRSEHFLESLLAKLETCLASPEEEILKQGSESEDMYWISQGDCAVNIREQDQRERIAVRLLVEGDHFGEIGLAYGCRRTASIVSRNYNTMARLIRDRYRELISEFPEYAAGVKSYAARYNYKKKAFIRQIFQKIEYLSDLPEDVFHHAFYSLKQRLVDKYEVILKEESETDKLIIVEHGCLMLCTDFEGNRFPLEYMHQGFVLNPRVIFMEDPMYVQVKAVQPTYILELELDQFNDLRSTYPEFGKRVGIFENRMLRSSQKYPLDLLYRVPRQALEHGITEGALVRQNIFKNVVFQIIIKIRDEKRKPKLSDILRVFSNLRTKEQKEFVINKLKILYDGTCDIQEEEDLKFQQLMTLVSRMRKSINHTKETIFELESRVLVMQQRKEQRALQGQEYTNRLQSFLEKASTFRQEKKRRDTPPSPVVEDEDLSFEERIIVKQKTKKKRRSQFLKLSHITRSFTDVGIQSTKKKKPHLVKHSELVFFDQQNSVQEIADACRKKEDAQMQGLTKLLGRRIPKKDEGPLLKLKSPLLPTREVFKQHKKAKKRKGRKEMARRLGTIVEDESSSTTNSQSEELKPSVSSDSYLTENQDSLLKLPTDN